MATTLSFFTTDQAARKLGVCDSRVRQLLIAADGKIGAKHGVAWLLSDGDIERLRQKLRHGKKPAV